MKHREKKNGNRLSEQRDTFKCNNISIMGILEREEREKGAENLLRELTAENFPHLGKETEIQIQEAQKALKRINQSTPRHTVIKMAKSTDKEF